MPLDRKQSIVGHMPTRSASIIDVLGAVRQLPPNHKDASRTPKPAPLLDDFSFGDLKTEVSTADPFASKKQQGSNKKKQNPLRPPLSKTPQPFGNSSSGGAGDSSKVVQFPTELRQNRFFGSPELSAKATQYVLEGRRPSSVFSGAISDTCRAELHTIHRVQMLQQVTNEMRSPAKQTAAATPSPGFPQGGPAGAAAAAASEGGGNPPRLSPLPGNTTTTTASAGGQLAASYCQSMSPAQQLVGAWQNDAQYLRHVDAEDREELPGLHKLGRRLEYGKVLGLYREELLVNRSMGKYAAVPKHKEVGDAKAPGSLPPLDWSHMGIESVASIIDILPRTGKVMPTPYALQQQQRDGSDRHKRRAQEATEKADAGGAKPPGGPTPASAGGAEGAPSGAAPPGAAPSAAPAAAAGHQAQPLPSPAAAAAAPAVAPSRSMLGMVTAGPSTAPEHLPAASASRYDSLRFCFGDKDAERVMPSSVMVIIQAKDTTYAFHDPKKKRGIEALLKSGGLVGLDGKVDINRCLGCTHQFDGRLANLSHNKLQCVDRLLFATLATLLRTSLVRLDVSFNNIRTINSDFFGVACNLTAEQKQDQLEATTEKLAQLQEDLSNEPATASLLEKKKGFLKRVRMLALLELSDPEAPRRLIFESLRGLYLHGNPLDSFEEIFKLKPLARTLQALTFHGGSDALDREATQEKNRRRLLQTFPSLVSLNFTTLVASDDQV